MPKLNRIKPKLGELIKTHRKLMGLTQEELAAKLDITFQQVQKYEYNKNTPSIEIAQKIARVLRIPSEKIFGEYLKDDLIAGVKKEIIDNYEVIEILLKSKELHTFISNYEMNRKNLKKIDIYSLLNDFSKLSPNLQKIVRDLIRKLASN